MKFCIFESVGAFMAYSTDTTIAKIFLLNSGETGEYNLDTFEGSMEEFAEYVKQTYGRVIHEGHELHIMSTGSIKKLYTISSSELTSELFWSLNLVDQSVASFIISIANLHKICKYLSDNQLLQALLEYLFANYIGYLLAFVSGCTFRDLSDSDIIHTEGLKFDPLYVLIKEGYLCDLNDLDSRHAEREPIALMRKENNYDNSGNYDN